MMQIIKTALLLVLISPVVLAQEIRPLDSILATIRSKNPLLQGYDYQMEAIQAYAEGAKGWSAPMVGVGTFMTPYPGQAVMNDGDKGMLMLVGEQAIPNPAKLRAREDYLTSRAAIEDAGQRGAYNQLRAQAKSLYYEWLVQEKQKKVLEEDGQIMERSEESRVGKECVSTCRSG